MEIRLDDLLGPEIAEFLAEHLREMRAVSPPESKHALDLAGLRKPDITFWTVWDGPTLVGCGALKQLNSEHGEVKSMRIGSDQRGKGVASQLMEHILNEATDRGYSRLSLETGSMPYFAPARALYRKYGFQECPPFAQYKLDPHSCFMTKDLTDIVR